MLCNGLWQHLKRFFSPSNLWHFRLNLIKHSSGLIDCRRIRLKYTCSLPLISKWMSSPRRNLASIHGSNLKYFNVRFIVTNPSSAIVVWRSDCPATRASQIMMAKHTHIYAYCLLVITQFYAPHFVALLHFMQSRHHVHTILGNACLKVCVNCA